MKRFLYFKFLPAILLSLLLVNACAPGKDETESETEAVTPVTITHVTIGQVSEIIELNATTVNKKNIIRSNMSGVVESVEINSGDNVAKGQILFRLKTKEAYALGKSSINDSSLNFKGAIAIKAVKNGSVSSISHQKGDYVQEGDELAQISDPNSLIFLLDVPFEMRSFITPGIQCEIVLPDNCKINGKITSSLPIMDMNSQIENFVIQPQIQEKLPENLIARVRIIKSEKKRALLLPKNAILTNETQTEFWIMKLLNDSLAVKVYIEKGIEENKQVEIINPVFSNTDRILLTGNYGLPDTAKVMVMK